MKTGTLFRCAFVVLLAVLIVIGTTGAGGVWAQPDIWYVSSNGSDVGGDGSEARPFATIQHGIDTAAPGDTVPVHPRIYLPFLSAVAPIEFPMEVIRGASLQLPRAHHTATRLSDGRILVVGGSQAPDSHLSEVEIYDPKSGVGSPVAPLHTSRHDHTATLLPDGRVLVVGGYTLPQQWLTDAEVYNPDANTWTVLPPHYSHGVTHSATLMGDGRVLVVGGATGSGIMTERVEIFDPTTNLWADALALNDERGGVTAALLADGRVLVIGGTNAYGVAVGGDALIYDAETDNWTATAPMVEPREKGQSVSLADGRVLVVGGIGMRGPAQSRVLASTEIYDPLSNRWAAAGDLSVARHGHALAPLLDGRVLAIGGAREYSCCMSPEAIREIEIYDPAAASWSIAAELPQPGVYATAAPMADGRVWVAGGQSGASYWVDTWLISARLPPASPPNLIR